MCATLVLLIMISRSNNSACTIKFELNSFCQTLDLWQSTLYLAYFRFLNWFEYSETTLLKRCFSPSTWAISLELWRCCCWPFTKITWKLSNAGVFISGFFCILSVYSLFIVCKFVQLSIRFCSYFGNVMRQRTYAGGI